MNMESFKMRIGFSTGSIALDDVRRGIMVATHHRTRAIELSALREDELDPLLESLDQLTRDLKPFEYISFHAPSQRSHFSEREFVKKLQTIADRGWPIIVHPDIIEDHSEWQKLGESVCVENMDKRKRFGRTAAQLREVFEMLPDATFCFDIGHARQIDPTMQEAVALLQNFKSRMRQIHMSYVNSQSRHERLNYESILAFRIVSRWIEDDVPIILETPVQSHEVDEEIDAAQQVFAKKHLNAIPYLKNEPARV
ncbi:hypothetical protein [Lacunimicrobium album]